MFIFIFSFTDLNRSDIELHVYSYYNIKYTAGLSILCDTVLFLYRYLI